MDTETLRSPVRRLVDAVNNGDMEQFLDQFAPDGSVDDFGRRFTGREEIRGWSDRESIGLQQTFEVKDHSENTTQVTVNVEVGGRGFNGSSTFVFTLNEDGTRVREMKIVP